MTLKAHLMYADRDFSFRSVVPITEGEVAADLERDALVSAMAAGDPVVAEVATEALWNGLTDLAAIRYRQAALGDAVANSAAVRELYELAVEALEAERRAFLLGLVGRTPGSVLFRAVELLELLEERLRRLRAFADKNAARFGSVAFTNLFDMLRRELGDDYLGIVREHLGDLRFTDGVLSSARLGPGNKGVDYELHRIVQSEGWLRRAFGARGQQAYSFRIPDQDEGGARALAALKDRGIARVADALARSMDHILSFFKMLRTELAFYVGCLNIREALAAAGAPACTPTPCSAADAKRNATGLYDPSLALTLGRSVVRNDLAADGKALVLVTGANRGGKSTFLRSLGLAQLMMQCGMFVAAERFEASVCRGVFTHYKRQEDPTMQSGKFDEELVRMSAIVDAVVPGSLVLLNESFAATDEREGAEIAHQVVTGLIDCGVIACFVTHQYELAERFMTEGRTDVLFLLAERRDDGSRTFRIKPGRPLETSYGKDIYDRIFDDAGATTVPP